MIKKIKILVAQIQMHTCLENHVSGILSVLDQLEKSQVDLCIFPELTLTGFRGDTVSSVTVSDLSRALSSITALCKKKSVSMLIGLIRFEGKERYNSYVFIDAAGEIQGHLLKSGLTETERVVFSSGKHRPTFSLKGVKFSAVICREVEDHDSIDFDLSPDVIFWPGYIGETIGDGQEAKRSMDWHAAELCKKHEAFLIQVNWGKSHRPDISLCGSAVVNKTGEVLSRLPGNVSAIGMLSVSPDSVDIHFGYE